jgi:hypothetical protein
VLVNNRGTVLTTDDVPIQFLAIGAGTTPFQGMQPCAFPQDQQEHLTTPGDTSVQLVNNAGWDASIGAVNIYDFSWQGLLQNTFGAINAGQSEWGAFGENFGAALLQFPPAGDPARLPANNQQNNNGGNPTPVGTNPCQLGRMTDWSACSVPCIATANASNPGAQPQTTGWQIQYQPILFTINSNFDVSTCAPLLQRSQARTCAPAGNPQTQTDPTVGQCTACTNEVRDGQESDVDCGGGVADSFGNWTLQQVAALVKQRYNPLPQTSVSGLAGNGTNPTCPRCNFGRSCSVHSDCNTDRGLLCLQNSCQPWWFVNQTTFVDVTLTITGADVRDIASNQAALDVFQTTLAEVASSTAGATSGNGTTGARVLTRMLTDSNWVTLLNNGSSNSLQIPAYNVSATSWTSSAGPVVNDNNNQPAWALKRRLASASAAEKAAAVPEEVTTEGRALFGRKLTVGADGSLVPVSEAAAAEAEAAESAAGAASVNAAAAAATTMSALHHIHGVRALANSADTLTVAVRIAVPSAAAAVAAGQNLRVNAQLLSWMLQERLRIYSATIGATAVGQPTVLDNPYNFTAPPAQRAQDVGGNTNALSVGAIIGIVVGCLAGVALVAVAAVAGSRYMRREPPAPRRRAGIDIGEARPQGDASAGLAGGAASRHTKAAFAPTAAAGTSAAATSTVAAGATAAAAPSAPPAEGAAASAAGMGARFEPVIAGSAASTTSAASGASGASDVTASAGTAPTVPAASASTVAGSATAAGVGAAAGGASATKAAKSKSRSHSAEEEHPKLVASPAAGGRKMMSP